MTQNNSYSTHNLTQTLAYTMFAEIDRECFASKQQFTTKHFTATESKTIALDSYLGFVNNKFEEMKNNSPSISNKVLSQAKDALSGVNYFHSGVNDVHSGVNYVHSGVNDALSGVNYILSGVNDALSGVNYVHSGLDDVLSGVNYIHSGLDDVLSGVNDVLSGLNEDKEIHSYGCSVYNKPQYINTLSVLLTN